MSKHPSARHEHRAHHHPALPSWISVEEARERALHYVRALGPEEKPLLPAQGQVLAEDIRAPLDVPPSANTAMDGYAVRWEDIRQASRDNPTFMKVIGELPAGAAPSQAVTPGTAIRIMTGAPIPPGADAVVPFEDTDELDRRGSNGQRGPLDVIGVRVAAPRGYSIRPPGEDIKRGELALRAGSVLRPAEIGVLASLGFATVKVVRRPVVAVLATGDELVEPGEPPAAGKIYNSNSFSVAAAVARYGGVPKLLGIARDTLSSLEEKIAQARGCDLLLTSAGVSRGDYDLVKDVLARNGQVHFWTVRMKPAKPLAMGVLFPDLERPLPHLGLPGNPVSALVAFEQLARPAILKMLGKTRWDKPSIEATLEDDIENTDGRRVYARVVVTKREGRYYARLTGSQSSGVLTSMAKANGLAICPEDVPVKRAGDQARVEMLDWPEEGP